MAGPSAKFAAFWTDVPGLESAVVIPYPPPGETQTDTGPLVDSNSGYTLATIKVPQAKELLVGLSAEIGLVTFNAVKGKNGGTARAIADAEAYVTVFAVPTGAYDETTNPTGSIMAKPGAIKLSKRVQELGATLGGVIQSCSVTCVEEDVVDPDGVVIGTTINCEDIVIVEDCEVTDEEISLLLKTTAAHHFNLVFPDLPQGEYDIVAVFTTGASAEVDICDADEDCMYDPEGTVAASAEASAVINKTMLTVQQVRAVKGSMPDPDDPSSIIEID